MQGCFPGAEACCSLQRIRPRDSEVMIVRLLLCSSEGASSASVSEAGTGRFDREFYFPLPNTEGRRAILDIHTKDWDPPLPDHIKDELAEITKGYGGADLRALCTEAAADTNAGGRTTVRNIWEDPWLSR